MPLSNIVNVQITRETQSVSEAGFGTLMILGTSKSFNDLVRQYTNIQEVAVDFATFDPEYIAAQDVFSQPICPEFILIGRRTVDTVGVLVETALPAETYTIKINDTNISVNSTNSVEESTVTLSGVVTNVIQFDANFVAGCSMVATVNGLPLAAVTYQGSQTATRDALAAVIQAAPGVNTATGTGGQQITVVFDASDSSIVDSVVNNGTGSINATITQSGPLVTANLINVSLNGEIVGTVTSKITYSTAFTAGSSVVTTVNGVAGAAVVYSASNAQVLTDIAAQLAGLTGVVASAVSNGTNTITVVFTNPGNNTVDSSITTGGSTPTAVISEGGFVFTTDQLTTMTNIATAIETALNVGFSPGIGEAVVSGTNNNVITVNGNPGQEGIIDFFTVTLGAQQATAAIDNNPQPTDKNTIAQLLTDAINDFTPDLGVTASTPSTPNGTLSITADVAGVPYTIAVSSSVTNPNQARVKITQVIPAQAYTVILEGVQFTYQAPNDVASNEQIAAGLVALINDPLSPVLVGATDNLDGSFELISTEPTAVFIVQVNPLEAMVIQKGLILQPYVPSAAVVDDLQAIQDVNDDWYALACTDRTVATVQAIADWIETQIKIFGTASDNPIIVTQPPGVGAGLDSTSIAYYLFSHGLARSFCLYSEDADSDYPECAWFGNCLPLTPGSETWAFKTLNSISYSDLSSNQESNAFKKNCNTYEYVGGVGITQRGTMAVGEYIDIIRGVDWLTSTIQTYVYSVLVNSPKIPYTDAGITAIESQIRRALQLAISNDFIAQDPPYQIFVPKAANVPSVDKANRILRNVKFQATLAGAIQAIRISGTVSV